MKKSTYYSCHCNGHIIEVKLDSDKMLWIGISDVYGKERKLKKPKPIADVVLYDKELTKFVKMIKGIKL